MLEYKTLNFERKMFWRPSRVPIQLFSLKLWSNGLELNIIKDQNLRYAASFLIKRNKNTTIAITNKI